jgi:trk system potassium uptake protein TrkA
MVFRLLGRGEVPALGTQQNKRPMSSLLPTDDDSADTVGQERHFVLGGGRTGVAIAEQLQTDGHPVTVVDEECAATDVPAVEGTPTDLDHLTEAELETASTVIVVTQSDAQNFLIAQLVRTHFDIPRIIVLVNDPERLDPLAKAGHEPLCVPSALSETVTEKL